MRVQRSLRVEVVGEQREAALRVSIGDDTRVLDGPEVEALIEKLALYRSAMKPAVSARMSKTHSYHIAIDPCWYAEPNEAIDGMVVFFRHQGIGWTGYALPGEQLDALRRDLREAAGALPLVAKGALKTG